MTLRKRKFDFAIGKTYLTCMNATTRVSAKGQVVIPKDVRDRLKLAVGDLLEVVERPDGVLLRKRAVKSGESFDQITTRIRARIRYAGPRVSIDEMDQAIAEMWATGGPCWDQ